MTLPGTWMWIERLGETALPVRVTEDQISTMNGKKKRAVLKVKSNMLKTGQ